jgi:chemotaxis protein MotB
MPARRDRSTEENGSGNEWLTTYSDLVTLLLCFFVLLFSFSEIDAKKFEAIIRSFQGSLSVLDGGKTIDDDQFINQAMQSNKLFRDQEEVESMERLYQQLDEYIHQNNLQATVVLAVEERGLLIRFNDQVLFDSGKADIKKEVEKILDDIGKILNQNQKLIRVEGHTDNVPIHTQKYPSNWELSTARAVNVVKFFIERTGISPARLSAAGYSEYHPIASNDTSENRQKNRRVDVVILKASYAKAEPYY